MDYYSNTAKQNFLIEKFKLDNLKSTRWFLKHKEVIAKRAEYTEKHKHYTDEQISKKQIESQMSDFSKQHQVSARYRRKQVLDKTTALNDFFEKSEQPSAMKPVDPEESNIIYKNLSCGGGRKAYLNTRKRKLPEEKYNSCESSNVYGWALGESCVGYGAPKHPRYATFLHDLTRLSGVHPDPPHYETPIEVIYKKCY